MYTTAYKLIGTNNKLVKIIAPVDILFPSGYVDKFDSFCGAGTGIGDAIVPETIWGVKVSPACFVHDKMWEAADGTWEAFHASNSIFLTNLISLIEVQSKSSVLKRIRLYRAVTYYNTVDSIGPNIFWNLKKTQTMFA